MKKSWLLSLMFVSDMALACSCALHDVADFVSHADVIVTARLVAANSMPGRGEEALREALGDTESFREYVNDLNNFAHIEAVFQVDEVLKGDGVADSLILKTGMGGGDCGVPMTIGRNYILFIAEPLERINICSGSRELQGHEEAYLEQVRQAVFREAFE